MRIVVAKPLKPTTDLVGGRTLDVAKVVTMLMFDGATVSQIAKKLCTTVPAIEQTLAKGKTREMIQKAHEDRMQLVAHVPIANYANRLRRLENILINNGDDPKIQIAALREAREETKSFWGADEEEIRAPQITVNIAKYEAADDAAVPMAVQEAVVGLTTVKIKEPDEND